MKPEVWYHRELNIIEIFYRDEDDGSLNVSGRTGIKGIVIYREIVRKTRAWVKIGLL